MDAIDDGPVYFYYVRSGHVYKFVNRKAPGVDRFIKAVETEEAFEVNAEIAAEIVRALINTPGDLTETLKKHP